jgi:hypothetical protein
LAPAAAVAKLRSSATTRYFRGAPELSGLGTDRVVRPFFAIV